MEEPVAACPIPTSPGRPCAIAGAPCPGFCPFSALSLVDVAGILVFLEPGFRFYYANEQAATLLGDTPPEAAALAILQEARPGPFASSTHLQQFFRREAFASLNNRLIKATVLQNASAVVLFLVDVTEAQRMHAFLAEIEMSDAITRLFSVVRHELGNRANAILMTLHVLENKLMAAEQKDLVKYTSRIKGQFSKMNDLLASFKVASIAEAYNEEIFNIVPVLRKVHSFFYPKFPFLSLECLPQIPSCAVIGCQKLLEHSLMNLVSNALDAVQVCDDPKVEIRLSLDSSHARVDVEDNGSGIPAEIKAELFKPFFSTKPKGTGLGLFLVKTWVRKMGGTVEVSSQPGRTTFSVVLRRPVSVQEGANEPGTDG